MEGEERGGLKVGRVRIPLMGASRDGAVLAGRVREDFCFLGSASSGRRKTVERGQGNRFGRRFRGILSGR